MTIDAVITWVDGNDPILNAKRAEYEYNSASKRSDIAGATRYADLGEIHWCVRSLNKYAPWLRKIFIITDGQDPKVESRIPVEIVDHKQIFAGYEVFLPSFNSISIETVMWRIPDLSEHFIYLNDDFLLIKTVQPSDFFTEDGRTVCYARKISTLWAKSLYYLSCLKKGYERVTFKRLLYQGAELAGNRRCFYYLTHTPRAFCKSDFEKWYEKHPQGIIRNLKYRFRDARQYQPQSLAYEIMRQNDVLDLHNSSKPLMFVSHWNGTGYLQKKFAKADKTEECKFACFNSLDRATEAEKLVVITWVKSKL